MSITLNGTTGLAGANGSASTPAVQGEDANTGIFFPAADTVAVATAGAERLRVDSSGNFGVGTTSPQAYSGYTVATIDNASSGGLVSVRRAGTALLNLYTAAGEGRVEAANSAILGLWTTSVERMRIDASGRITMPYQPAFLAYGSKSKSAGNWSLVSDAFSSTKYNVGGHYNTSAGRFTAPIAGRYFFYAAGYSPNSGNGARYAWSATVNGGPQEFIGGGDYLTVDSPLAGYSVSHSLSAGDYVDLYMFSEISATIGNVTHVSYFGGYLIG